MHEESVGFSEFGGYLARIGDDASKQTGLPKTEAEFEFWWQRISGSDELRARWTRRIRLGEKFVDEIADEIEAIRRAA